MKPNFLFPNSLIYGVAPHEFWTEKRAEFYHYMSMKKKGLPLNYDIVDDAKNSIYSIGS
jgi:hypothetical protein